jgi:prevent-host-death family protein
MKPVNMHDAKTHLSKLVERAAAGEEIIIAKAGKPVAKLVAIERNMTPRVAGSMRGKIWIADDFDDPLPPELQAYFTGDR